MSRHRPDPLAGETIVITCAASGIGRALARRMSHTGSPVAIADIDEPRATPTPSPMTPPPMASTVAPSVATERTAAGPEALAPLLEPA